MPKIIQCCCIVMLVFACKNKPKEQSEILAIKEMGDLATTEYVVTKIVKANDNLTWYKFGERKILMSCEASIKAGIDLTQIQPDDVHIDGKQITLYLPAPKIISFNMPPEKIKVEHKEIDILRSDFANADRDALLVQAENQIRGSVTELGIYETTQKQTTTVLTSLMQQLGYEQVTIFYGTKAPQNDTKN